MFLHIEVCIISPHYPRQFWSALFFSSFWRNSPTEPPNGGPDGSVDLALYICQFFLYFHDMGNTSLEKNSKFFPINSATLVYGLRLVLQFRII